MQELGGCLLWSGTSEALAMDFYCLTSTAVFSKNYNYFNFFFVSLRQMVWMKGNLLFSCTVFCPVWFFFIVVLSDTLTFICEETCNIVTLSILSKIFEVALSLTCVSYDLENHLPLCLQCIEQGFSHVHVLLKMQYYLIKVFFLTKWRWKKKIRYMQLWTW